MISVRFYDNAITIDGHASRDAHGDPTCCAAVSAVVQTAMAYFAVAGYAIADVCDPVDDHGGHAVLVSDRVNDDHRIMFCALTDILEAQANAWPGEIEILNLAGETYRR